MRHRYRLAAAVTAPLMLVSLAACSGSAGGGESGDDISITMVQGVTGLPFAQTAAAGAKAAIADVGGIGFDIAGPANIDPAAEVKIFQQVVSTRPRAILLHELPPELFTRPVEDAEAAGVVVLPYNIAPTADSSSTSYVGGSGADLGRMGADAMADQLIKQAGSEDVTGEIVTGICVPGLSVIQSRIDGFKERLAERLPNVVVLDPFDSKTDPAQDFTVWQQAVSANPNALGMMSPCEADVQNLIKIKRDSDADWLLAAFDINDEILKGYRDGLLVSLTPESHYMIGYVSARILAESLKNGTDLPEGWVEIPVVPVTDENIDAIEVREGSEEAQAAFWKPYIDDLFSKDPLVTRPLSDYFE
ncbi:sugar ABC transporter substrate-binding protein [uncultured Microbacterium sp.]|uniref:sugar ABC transporter substrate-binding protein n=1 Tax=uncultured Microbacterium sp. TaxID=191216 RepID=UPI0035C965BD